jgi:hypothetical protein
VDLEQINLAFDGELAARRLISAIPRRRLAGDFCCPEEHHCLFAGWPGFHKTISVTKRPIGQYIRLFTHCASQFAAQTETFCLPMALIERNDEATDHGFIKV